MSPKITDAETRIGLDLARTAAERCGIVMSDTGGLCDHPMQVWLIAMHVASAAIGAAAGAFQQQRPDMTEAQCTSMVFAYLQTTMTGGAIIMPDEEKPNG